MPGFGFGNAVSGLAAMYPGMVTGRRNEAEATLEELKAADAGFAQQGLEARGKALMNLFGGAPPPMSGIAPPVQPPMPGQPSVPMQAGSPPGFAGVAPGGPRPSPAPVQPLGSMDAQPGPVTAPQGAPDATTGQGGGQEAPLNGVGMQGGRPTIFGGVPNGPLTWQVVGSAIAKVNPGASPQAIAKAIDQFVPMMTAESQMQWHLMKLQQERELLGVKEEGKYGRARERNENQLTMAQMRNQVANRNAATRENATVNWTPENRMALEKLKHEDRMEIAKFTQGKLDERQAAKLEATAAWKQMDDDTKHKLLDARLDAMREMEETRQVGANERAAGVQAGQNERAAGVQAGLDRRNTFTRQSQEKIAADRLTAQQAMQDQRPVTAAQYRNQAAAQQYNSAVSTIDEAMQAVRQGHKTGNDVVGLKGKVLGIQELIGNLANWSDETSRNDFAQKIETLRATLPRLLTGSTITNKDERARMQTILQGLERGSTKQATMADLVWLRKKMQELTPAVGTSATQGDLRRSRQAPAGGAAEAPAPELKPMGTEQLQQYKRAIEAGHSRADIEKRLREMGFDPASAPAEQNSGGNP